MVTVSQLLQSHPNAWGAAEEALASLSKDLNEAADGLYDRGAGKLEEFWPDEHGEHARAEVTSLAASYTVLAMQLRGACSVLSGLELALTTCRNTVADGCDEAARYGYHVADDGTVTLPRELLSSANPAPHLAKAFSLESMIKEALSDATRIDQDAAAALSDERMTRLDADKDGDVDDQDIGKHREADGTLDMTSDAALEAIRDSMPLDGTPEEQRKWWDALSDEEREMYQNAVPLEVAGMAGLPDEVRVTMSDAEELGYDRLVLLQYAQDNWNNSDIDYLGNNCTNFVSHALGYAGLDPKGLIVQADDSWARSILHRNPFGGGPLPGTHSDSWGGANAQHDLFARSGSPHIPQDQVRPGDIAYWSQEGPGDNEAGHEHHAAIVTGVLPNGDVLYTQHTSNREDQSLAARQPYGDVVEGDQSILFLRIKQTW